MPVEPVFGPGTNIDLTLSPRVTEFLGFVNYAADRSALAKGEDPFRAVLAERPEAERAINQSIFNVRAVATSLTLKDGETAMLGGLRKSEGERLLFVFVTATRIDQKEMLRRMNAVRQAMGNAPPPLPPIPAVPSSNPPNFPYATPVAGKPGFVTSPYAPDDGYVDLRGYPPGAEVKCPYSQKMFLVP